MPRILLPLLLIAWFPAAVAWDGVAADTFLRCQQTDLQTLRCDYRNLTPADATLALRAAGADVPPRERNAVN